MLDKDFLIEGEKLNIVSLKGAGKSFSEAMEKVSPLKRQQSTAVRLDERLKHLANTRSLKVPDQYNVECDLPEGGKCYAVKAHKIRAYGWFSKVKPHHFIISHYVYKNYPKMKKADKNLIEANYKKFEGLDEKGK